MRTLRLAAACALTALPGIAHANLGPCADNHWRRTSGRFYLWYQHIVCRKAPCPTGGPAISVFVQPAGLQLVRPGAVYRDRCTARLARVVYDPATPAAFRLPVRKDVEGKRYVLIEGRLELAGAPATARIVATRARYSDDPPTDAGWSW